MVKTVEFDSFYNFPQAHEYDLLNNKQTKIVFNVTFIMGGFIIYPFLKETKFLKIIMLVVGRVLYGRPTKLSKEASEKVFLNISKVHDLEVTKPHDQSATLKKVRSVVKAIVEQPGELKPSDLVVRLDALLQNIDRDFDRKLTLTRRTSKLIQDSIQEIVENDLSVEDLKHLIDPKVSERTLLYLQDVYNECLDESESQSNDASIKKTLEDPIKWPPYLGITEKKEIRKFIKLNRETFKQQFAPNSKVTVIENLAKKKLLPKYKGIDGKPGGQSPSRTLYVLKHDILLDTNNILGIGGQTRANRYYGLLSGRNFAVKRLKKDNLLESTLSAYEKLNGKPGCVSYEMITDNLVIEPCYDATLDTELSKCKFKSTFEKVDALRQIAIGLESIHSEVYSTKITESNQTSLVGVWSGSMFHGDLTLKNIFVKHKGAKRKIAIGDYGFTAQGQDVSYCRDYCSPQTARFLENSKSVIEATLFNHAWGTQNDLWQFGIIAAAILKNKLNDGHPPLKFLERFRLGDKRDELLAMISLKQKEIDSEIQAYITKVERADIPMREKTALVKCWRIVNTLLQIQPRKRPAIEGVVRKLSKVLSQ